MENSINFFLFFFETIPKVDLSWLKRSNENKYAASIIVSYFISEFHSQLFGNSKLLYYSISIVKTPTSTQHNPKTTSTDVGFDMNIVKTPTSSQLTSGYREESVQ